MIKDQKKKVNNSKIKNIDSYIQKVLECIEMKQVQTISLESVIKMQKFFNESNDKSLNKVLQKILIN